MKLGSISLLAQLLATAAASRHHGKGQGLTVKTSQGEVTGLINSTSPDLRQWLGIPYAEPPLGELRFLPPKKKESFGKIDAKAYQRSCMQQLSNSSTVYTEYMPQFLLNGTDSEDCLYLNVYAPLNPTARSLPVFVYIPGGGFTGGGADSLYKIPDQWIQRTQSHLVVIMNYRVNIFGFPNAASAPQNAGLLDQRMVVEWVRDNIAAFGGDPEKITLWGQSAGGSSVALYGYAYPFDPIVTGLIADSGASSNLVATDSAHSAFSKISTALGCGDLEPRKELACLQKVDSRDIQQTLSFGGTGARFTPVADNITGFTNSTDRMYRGLFADVPYLTGSNANEGAGFGTFDKNGMTPGQYELGLSAITCPVATEVANRARFGYTTYRYLYSGNFSNISPLPWIGATHSAELPLIFGTHSQYRGNSTEFEWEVSRAMQDLWLSFARSPNKDPSEGHFVWPEYDPEKKTMVRFALDDVVTELVSREEVDNECSS